LPVAWVPINMESATFYQAQTDTYLGSFNTRICGNDYTGVGVGVQVVRNLFALPNASNPDPRPVFAAINCISNTPGRRYREVLVNEFYNGGGEMNFSASIATWRGTIDAVQAPPPTITDVRLGTNDTVRFTIPGQRGRINRVEGTTNFVDWITVTNITGTNAPVIVRDTNVLANPRRFYRVLRL
jgi:hypothetical protein